MAIVKRKPRFFFHIDSDGKEQYWFQYCILYTICKNCKKVNKFAKKTFLLSQFARSDQTSTLKKKGSGVHLQWPAVLLLDRKTYLKRQQMG